MMYFTYYDFIFSSNDLSSLEETVSSSSGDFCLYYYQTSVANPSSTVIYTITIPSGYVPLLGSLGYSTSSTYNSSWVNGLVMFDITSSGTTMYADGNTVYYKQSTYNSTSTYYFRAIILGISENCFSSNV